MTRSGPHALAAGADQVARRASGQPGAAVGERRQAVLHVGDDVADQQLERAQPGVHGVGIGSAPRCLGQSLGRCCQLRLCSHARSSLSRSFRKF